MQVKENVLRLSALFLFLLFATVYTSAQSTVFNLTKDNLKEDNAADLSKAGWKYKSGDEINWASPELDDSGWNVLPGASYDLDKLDDTDWRGGKAWFRLHFKTDESLRGKILGLSISYSLGASEIYLDGKLVRRFGAIEGEGENAKFVNIYGTPFAALIGESDEHLLAVRYRSVTEDSKTAFAKWLYNNGAGKGFYLAFSDINESAERREQSQRATAATTVSRAGIYLAVGLLHLLLFWFYPPQRANFYFGIFAVLTAASTFISYLQSTSGTADLSTYIGYRVFSRFAFIIYSTALLMFLYRAFLPKVPKISIYVFALWILTNATAIIFPSSSAVIFVFGVGTVWFVGECLRVMTLAVWRSIEGAWIVAAGILTAILAPLRYLYLAAGLVIPKEIDSYLAYASSYGLLIAVSIYLARNFARTSNNLEAQLSQVKELSARELEHQRTEAELRFKHEQERAENERRAQELEEARQLQLSMLPKRLPQIPNLEIAAYMKPATEVGGDYYDFHGGSDGTLTVAVGDATGHGLKANSMVTATKGLFNAFAGEGDITNIFRQSSAALKKMNLRGLFMAMTMLKVKDNHVTVGAAGMPSALIYRAASKSVEEISIKAMPLGSVVNFPYKVREFNLSAGDCVLLMSDGFPEMFNTENEMIGFEKAAEILPEIAGYSTQEIINRLVETGEQWANGRPQDDDVTFVVLKVKAIGGVGNL